MLEVKRGVLRDLLFVAESGPPNRTRDIIFTSDPLHVDVQMQLAHTLEDTLLRVRIHLHMECRVLLLEAFERGCELRGMFLSFGSTL